VDEVGTDLDCGTENTCGCLKLITTVKKSGRGNDKGSGRGSNKTWRQNQEEGVKRERTMDAEDKNAAELEQTYRKCSKAGKKRTASIESRTKVEMEE